MEEQLQFDLQNMPHKLPTEEPKKKKEQKKKEPHKVTAADEKVARKLAAEDKAKHEIDEKRAIVRKVNRYMKKFGDRIDVKLPRGFSTKMKLEDLQEVLQEIELELASAGGVNYVASLYAAGMGFVQDISAMYAARTGKQVLALSGPAADVRGSLLAQQQEWVPIIEELAIKYERWFAVGPERRLLFFTASLVTMVHRANTVGENLQQNADKPADEELQNELNDIF